MTAKPSSFYFPTPKEAKFCSQCAHPLLKKIPDDDSKIREVCDNCGAVHYQNPLVVVGTIPVYQNKILLCKRAIEPKYGYWTLPAGFMEKEETLSEGALRETQEEAGADIELGNLYTVIDVPKVSQVHTFFLARANSDKLDIGFETLEARYFDIQEIPWDEIAFSTVKTTLERYIHDTKMQSYAVHYFSLS